MALLKRGPHPIYRCYGNQLVCFLLLFRVLFLSLFPACLLVSQELAHHLEKLPLGAPDGFLSLALLACVAAHCLLAALRAGRLPLPSQVTERSGESTPSFQALSWRLLRALGALRVNAIGISCLVPSASEVPKEAQPGSKDASKDGSKDAVHASNGFRGVVQVKQVS